MGPYLYETIKVESKGKVLPSSNLSLTLALDKGGWSTPRPGRITPGKETRYPLYRRLGSPRAGLDGCGKSRPHRDSIPEPSSP